MILNEICAHKRVEVETRKALTPVADIQEAIHVVRPARDFRAALRKPGISLIAEIKKASPSGASSSRSSTRLGLPISTNRRGREPSRY